MHRIWIVVIAMAFCSAPLFACAEAATQTTRGIEVTTQLPRDVRPSHYTIAVTPHASSLTFDGNVVITIDVLEPTDRIVLNAVGMRFSSASIRSTRNKRGYPAPRIDVDEATQTASFAFPHKLAIGSYLLTMEYTGTIGTQANGLFAIDYVTASGEKRALYTQFENSDARKFVPSWDEPNYKATFDLTATVPSAQMAVSNMPIREKTDLGDGMTRVSFATSPKMSTYLLFFGLGDFDRATAKSDGVEFGVITQKGLTSQAQFALDSAQTVLREYNDYFAVPYPLPKLDNIASPGSSQFFGAMENWGAIFTFERGLLIDPAISTEADRQRIFGTSAHEIAHQWFGDLVTMQWWDDLWLNEGFATWMAGRVTEKLHPDWKAELRAVAMHEYAMSLDAVTSTHPVVQHIETVEQASQAFDSITYSKGASVIGMLEGYVGADAWRDGVRRYMKKYAYSNTRSDDLWREVEAAAGKPILGVAHDFTLQPGVPMISVDSVVCKDGQSTVTLTQAEFTKDRPDKKPLRWRVPVIAKTIGGKPSSSLIEGGKGSIELPGCGPVLLNAGQSGYYRSAYPQAQFAAIRARFAELAPIDQLGLMGDTKALGMVGLQPATDILELIKATPADADGKVWQRVADTLTGIDSYYEGDKAQQRKFRAFATAVLRPVQAKLGWQARPGEGETVAILRNALIDAQGELGDADVIKEARRRYAGREKDPGLMPGALVQSILGIVARHADADTWSTLHAAAKSEKSAMMKDRLYRLLASTEDKALAQRALKLSLTDEPGVTNSAAMISSVSRLHPDMAFDFAVGHREKLESLIDTTSSSRYFPRLADQSLDSAMVGKLNAYADKFIAASSRRAAETAIADIEYRISIRNKRLPEINAWLKRQGR
ncbi:MAG TPA: M1 family metallopeptidase [Dokdonella sp.]|uniref:M1 family metallopeptidase n=1 Tax=Dokdonella sp. TaxID=2291710 RepID=UPI002D8070CD|nr:M1 family metallopeptidase [Dokdonella sp.]HET9031267.1 M1 family metallopeptidase [Dokdonella sp.]